MQQRISMVTIASNDIKKLSQFYDGLGWQRSKNNEENEIVAYNLIEQVFSIYAISSVEKEFDLKIADKQYSKIILSYNVNEKDEVENQYQLAIESGATSIKAPYNVFWGGYVAVFADPENNLWEICYNPFSLLNENEGFQW